MNVKNASAQEVIWTLDLKYECVLYKGTSATKVDTILVFDDEDLAQIIQGKVSFENQKSHLHSD
jgi:hypothetical protein